MASQNKEQLSGILLLLAILIVSAGFTVGLTYAPCYASLCSEEFFPFATRVHIAGYYALLASIGSFLLLRVYSPFWKAISSTYLTRRELPVLKKRISVGGLALAVWIVGITVATTGFWVDAELNYWSLRTDALHWADAQIRLAVTGIIGHHCDILLGLVLIPVSRNSILGRVFELHQHTLLYAHKLLAYLFLVAATAHGAATYTFVATYAAASDDSPKKSAFNVDNPTLTQGQLERRGLWFAATLPTGMFSFLFIIIIVVTSLPALRRRSYNTFYYTHIICSSFLFLCASVHASTDFYFLLPGLLLWVLDWSWRLFRGDAGGQRKKVIGTLEVAEAGWYRLTLPVSAQTASSSAGDDAVVEKRSYDTHPLQTYYLNIPSISKLQNHAFTAAKIGTAATGPTFLFQRAQPRSAKVKQKKLEKEWTWKVGTVASAGQTVDNDDEQSSGVAPRSVELHIEGPYIPREANSYSDVDRIVCIVGGTGLTGAYSLALWWLEHRANQTNSKFTLIWCIRHWETASLSEWQGLEERVRNVDNMRLQLHVSSENGRLNVEEALRTQLGAGSSSVENADESEGRAWVYVSGPAGLLSRAEDACVDLARELRHARRGRRKDERRLRISHMEHYVAKWEV